MFYWQIVDTSYQYICNSFRLNHKNLDLIYVTKAKGACPKNTLLTIDQLLSFRQVLVYLIVNGNYFSLSQNLSASVWEDNVQRKMKDVKKWSSPKAYVQMLMKYAVYLLLNLQKKLVFYIVIKKIMSEVL